MGKVASFRQKLAAVHEAELTDRQNVAPPLQPGADFRGAH